MIYIGHNNNAPFFLEIGEELNTTDNVVVYTWDDFINNNVAWLKLDEEQELFYSGHPDATPEEVYSMQILEQEPDPEPEPVPEPDTLEAARRAKLAEIEAQDKFSEKFFVSVIRYQRDDNENILTDIAGEKLTEEVANYTLWMDRGLRTSMLNTTLPAFQKRGDITRTFWTIDTPSQEVEVPIEWAIERIPRLEIYATETHDMFASNTNAALAAITVEEIAQINVKANYPKFLTFELNLDLWNGSNDTETIN